MQLNVKALAVVSAIFWGVSLFWVVLIGGALRIRAIAASPEMAELLASIYPGITLTVKGAIIALIWGLVDGAICGAIFGWIYNYFSRKFS